MLKWEKNFISNDSRGFERGEALTGDRRIFGHIYRIGRIARDGRQIYQYGIRQGRPTI